MKIFSWFNTKLKNEYINLYKEQYGSDNILVITRSKLYYYNKVILRIIYWISIHVMFIISIYYLLDSKAMIQYWFWVWLLFWMIFYIIALENYIDYTMNYAIFTPDEAILVEQIGIFNRNIKSLDIRKIKSITIRKKNIFFSIFNDGIITILSEGNEHLWGITFKYVYNPEVVKEQIHNIILESPHRQSYHNNHSL